jgi:hypothetical protein
MPVEPFQIDLICSDIDRCQVSQLQGNWDTLAMPSLVWHAKTKKINEIKKVVLSGVYKHIRTVTIQVISQT